MTESHNSMKTGIPNRQKTAPNPLLLAESITSGASLGRLAQRLAGSSRATDLGENHPTGQRWQQLLAPPWQQSTRRRDGAGIDDEAILGLAKKLCTQNGAVWDASDLDQAESWERKVLPATRVVDDDAKRVPRLRCGTSPRAAGVCFTGVAARAPANTFPSGHPARFGSQTTAASPGLLKGRTRRVRDQASANPLLARGRVDIGGAGRDVAVG